MDRMMIDEIVVTVVLIILSLFVFIVCRGIVSWYYKVDERIDNQKEIISLLESINSKLSDKNPIKLKEIKDGEVVKNINDLYSKNK